MQFIGNTKIINLLQKSLERGQVNHAYLFSGPEHVGKFTLAKLFAQSLILGKGLAEDVEEISKDALFDMLVISPELSEKSSKQKDITIESVRDAKKSLSLFPYHGKYKVLIVDDAHRTNVSAQNALLKILEEPNRTTIIILVASDINKILSTIQSRLQIMNFNLVKDDEMEKIFAREIVPFSAGRPGLARIMEEDKEEFAEKKEASAQLEKIRRGSLGEKLEVAEDFSKDVVKAIDRLNIWMWNMRKEALADDGGKQHEIFAKIGKIQDSIDLLRSTNASSRVVLEALFMEL